MATCPDCNGRGRGDCNECMGTGIAAMRNGKPVPCSYCKGTKIGPCIRCQGSGRV